MGTRYFSATEKEDSRIKWEKADSVTAGKLALAINKYSSGLVTAKVARILVFFPAVIWLILLVLYITLLAEHILQSGISSELVFYLVFGAAIVFLGILLLTRYIRFRPYLYPEKQPDIWIFRAKCSDAGTHGMGSDMSYHAYFQKGGGHIAIRITGYEYKLNPTGKEYLFFKFNDRTGNRWAAIPAEKLDEF